MGSTASSPRSGRRVSGFWSIWSLIPTLLGMSLFIFLMLTLPPALAVAKARRPSRLGKWVVVVPLG